MKICYVFTAGRRERLNSGKKFPDDFFYGYIKLQGNKKIVQQSDFDQYVSSNGIFGVIIAKILLMFNLDYSFLRTILLNRNMFADSEIICLTTNSQGVHFSFLKIMGFFKGKRIIFIPMGLYAKGRKVPFWGRLLYPLYFCRTVLITISKSEEQVLRKKLFFSLIRYCPFGVDAAYWTPGEAKAGKRQAPYALSIGNDQNRDYELLLKVWKPEFPVLKIITSLPTRSKLPENVEVLRGNWGTNLIDDEEIKDYFRQALFVIIPLKETSQPAGQSAALQAMACGKAVILSRIKGLWDTEHLRHMEACYLVEPHNREDLVQAIDFLRKYPEQAERLGGKARQLIEGRFNSRIFTAQLEATIKEITAVGTD
jgi:glycosyltransferase involved in cell wall biosynthesis